MRMKAFDRKLLRDLRRMWSQALTIALVVASGLGGFITCLSAVDSLALARDQFYARGHFADAFVTVKRAPLALAEVLRGVPGVADVQVTVEQVVRVQMTGVADPILGQLIGVDLRQPPRMNQVTVGQGRALAPAGSGAARGDGAIDALVSEGFASVRGLRPGDELTALVNGKQRQLRIVGTALSPEFIFAGLAGMPDMRGFGVFWVDREALAAAYDMQGAFNRVAIKLAPQASEPAVLDGLSRLLAPYGGRDVRGREDQTSHAMLNNEIKEMHVMGTVLPAIFLAVAAFLLHVELSRLVSTQREQIAALKALGYANAAIAGHYLKLVALIVAVGLVLGVALGDWLGTLLTRLYMEFFFFPVFEHRIAPWLILVGACVTGGTALLGTLSAVGATVRLAPAEAMRPPAPGLYRRTTLERLGVQRIPPALRMVLRNMERKPLRTLLTIGGTAAAVAIVIMGNFFRDAIDHIVDTTFHLSMRSDVNVWMAEPVDALARLQLARLPGVHRVEPTRSVAVRIQHGHRSERVGLQGVQQGAQLQRIIDVEGRQSNVPTTGLLLTDRLADKLGIRVGDTVLLEVLEGRQRSLQVRVQATVREMMGLNAYVQRDTLNRWLQEGDVASQFGVALEPGTESRFLEATKELPRVAGAFSKATLLRNMQDVSARNVRIMSTILTLFAAVIAVGVVYNNARIALAERTWELASLRVLGFTRGEVSALLLGELAIGIALALPLGMALGWGLVHLVVTLLKNDQFLFPVVISASTYAVAGLCVVAAGAASALVVRRRIDRLDMVGALKTRE
ncbi:MAG: ABC transporter permease [Giesbergeria sp.]|jgi:putative ABC transport system permease protein|nr:ABC transporter permease [Giesbergeria sp.]